jgi:hypothetical protein
MLPKAFYKANISLILKEGRDTRGREKSQANIPNGHTCKNLQ